jgi:hypothetical protein
MPSAMPTRGGQRGLCQKLDGEAKKIRLATIASYEAAGWSRKASEANALSS